MITSIKISTLSKGIYLNGYEDKDFKIYYRFTDLYTYTKIV